MPVIGRALVDMLDGMFRADMEFLQLTRFDQANQATVS